MKQSIIVSRDPLFPPDISCVIDEAADIIQANTAALEHFGLSGENILGISLLSFIHADDLDAFLGLFLESLKNPGLSEPLDLRLMTPGDDEEWYEARIISRFHDPDIKAAAVSFRDVSRRVEITRRTEDKLKILEEKSFHSACLHKNILEFSINGIALGDLQNNLTYVNPAFLRMWGYNALQEVLGRRSIDFWENGDEAADVIKAIKEKGGWIGEMKAKKKDGSFFDVEVASSLIKDDSGEPLCYMAGFIDVTSRKKMEENVLESQRKLRELAAHLQVLREGERKRFSQVVHNELGQKITALRLQLIRLREDLSDKEIESRKLIETLVRQADDSLHTIQKLATEMRPTLLDEVGLNSAMEWQVKKFREQTGVDCDIRLVDADGLISSEMSIVLFRILQEALTNIARHARASKVEVAMKMDKDTLTLDIRDDGVGITSQQVSDPRAFGLIGMQESVLPWQGRLEIKGEKNKGTTIHAALPIRKGEGIA